jgi:FMN-dependent NADH-azoreductase
MPTLLHLNASPLGGESISRRLTEEFVQRWKRAHPDGDVITRDLTASDLHAVDCAWFGAASTTTFSAGFRSLRSAI